MHTDFTGRGTEVNPKQKAFAHEYLQRIDEILGRKAVSAHVVLSVEGHRQSAEVTVKDAAETLVAHCEGTDMHTQLHDALRKIEQQAVKHKERRLTIERHAKPDSAEPLVEVPDLPGA